MFLLGGAAVAMHVAEFHFVVAAAEQHHLLRFLRQIFPRRFGVELVVLGHRGDQREVIGVLAIPALDGAAREREMWIGDDAQRIEEILEADAIAGGAGARGAVERKHLRLERRHAVAALRAGLARGEQRFVFRLRGFLRVVRREARGAAGQLERRLERFGQALRGIGADAQSIHHGLDGVFLLGVDLRQRRRARARGRRCARARSPGRAAARRLPRVRPCGR